METAPDERVLNARKDGEVGVGNPSPRVKEFCLFVYIDK